MNPSQAFAILKEAIDHSFANGTFKNAQYAALVINAIATLNTIIDGTQEKIQKEGKTNA